MSKLNIFIDGTWLSQICKKGRSLSKNTIYPDSNFTIDYKKLNKALLDYVNHIDTSCNKYGELYFVTSVFKQNENFNFRNFFSEEDVQNIENKLSTENKWLKYLYNANYNKEGIHVTTLTPNNFSRFMNGTLNEKQVDTHVAILLVESAINNPNDYHVVITGDNDIVPAIDMAIKYSKNIFIATSNDHDRPDNYISSYKQICDLELPINPFYLEAHIATFMRGNHVYKCSCCSKVFGRQKKIPKNVEPVCTTCYQFYKLAKELNISINDDIYNIY